MPPEGGKNFEIPTQPLPDTSQDEKAEREAAALAFDMPLESARTERRLARLSNKNAVDGTINQVLRCLIWVGAVVSCLAFLVLFFHFLAPEHWLFLSPERLLSLKELLFSGTFGAGLAALWRSQQRSDDLE